jgi:hypothetical protein
MGVCIFNPKRDAKGVQYMPRDRSLYRWGMISRSTKCESDPGPQHPMKQEITKFIMFYYAGVLPDLNNQSSLKTWHSSSSTSKYCVTASMTDKDDSDAGTPLYYAAQVFLARR